MGQSQQEDTAPAKDHADSALNSNEPERIRFPGMEVGTDISMELHGASIRIKSRLIGIEPDRFLIIRLPLGPENLHRFEPGSKVIVRYLFNGSAIGFTSSIIQVFSNPVTVCFLEFPNSAECINLRKEKRIQCFFPGVAHYKGIELEGAILDLSSGGCRFFIEEFVPSGEVEIQTSEKISLHVEAFGPLDGWIANITNFPGILSIGIAFTDVSPEFEQRVKGMLEMASKFLPFQT